MSNIAVPETMSDFSKVVFGNPIGCDRKDGLWGLHDNGRWYKLSANRSPAPAEYPITPDHIKKVSFVGVFGRKECEIFATQLVQLAKAAGGWKPFSMQEIASKIGPLVALEGVQFFEQLGFLSLVGNDEERRCYTIGFISEVYDYQ